MNISAFLFCRRRHHHHQRHGNGTKTLNFSRTERGKCKWMSGYSLEGGQTADITKQT